MAREKGSTLTEFHKKRISESITKKWTEEQHRKNRPKVIMSEETLKKISGTNHHSWKGDKVSINGLHKRMGRYIPMPKICPKCKKDKPLDLCSINHTYTENPKDWCYRCRECHRKMDKEISCIT